MKKSIVFLLISCGILFSSFMWADCYSTWLNSYENAVNVFNLYDVECNSVYYGWNLCHAENLLQFETSLNNAADAFNDCAG